jgi:hypothetical protein
VHRATLTTSDSAKNASGQEAFERKGKEAPVGTVTGGFNYGCHESDPWSQGDDGVGGGEGWRQYLCWGVPENLDETPEHESKVS